ncbi:hypothetical protein JXD38_01460 [candidate division WOR-3 bacterium]|nr:hypothetical protein [candidate division WOR-3 bacterium]
MTARALTVALVVLAVVSCGRKTETQTSASAPAKWPKEALAPLTDGEVDQLVQALPALNGALKAANWETSPQKPGTTPLSTLTDLVEGMNVAGIDESLKQYGGWGKIRPILYRVYAASAALVIDRAPPDLIARMKQDTSEGARQSMNDYDFFKAACTQVPDTNKKMIAKYEDQLQPLGSLGR